MKFSVFNYCLMKVNLMKIFKKIKQTILNQSDMYRFYEYEYKKNNDFKKNDARVKKLEKNFKKNDARVKKLEKDFKVYKNETERVLNSYNTLFNSLYVYNNIEPKKIVRLSRDLDKELIDFVDNVCKKHNLQWWMFAGTLLGAIRHEGFVPWDDDCDLNMMREDYEKFFKVFHVEIEEHGLVGTIEANTTTVTAQGVFLPFIKINYWLGHENLAFLDIFPTDYMEDEIDDYRNQHIQEHRKMREQLRNGENREIVLNDSLKRLHLTKNKTDKLTNGVEDPTFTMITDYETIFPLKKIKFEDRYYPCPNDHETYIKKLYGERYNKIPRVVYDHGYYDYLSTHENVHSKLEDAIKKLHEVNVNF